MQDCKVLIEQLLGALVLNQYGFNHSRCSICGGWDMSPWGETDYRHTKDCPIAAAITAGENGLEELRGRIG